MESVQSCKSDRSVEAPDVDGSADLSTFLFSPGGFASFNTTSIPECDTLSQVEKMHV